MTKFFLAVLLFIKALISYINTKNMLQIYCTKKRTKKEKELIL